MDKQRLLDQVQAARDLLDEVALGQLAPMEYVRVTEISGLVGALVQLTDVLEQVIPALAEAKATAEMCEAVLERNL